MINTAPIEQQPVRQKGLNEYNDKISENFFGEQTMVTKLVNTKTGMVRLITRLKERLGPIMLKIKHGNLNSDWSESCRTQVDDYKVDFADEVCINENWITQAPNVLIFSLQRLFYEEGRLVKKHDKFTFD